MPIDEHEKAIAVSQTVGSIPHSFDFTKVEDVEKLLLTRDLGYWPPGPHVVSRMLDALVVFHESREWHGK